MTGQEKTPEGQAGSDFRFLTFISYLFTEFIPIKTGLDQAGKRTDVCGGAGLKEHVQPRSHLL